MYHYTRRREIYTTGRSDEREAEARERDVVPGSWLRYWRPTPVHGRPPIAHTQAGDSG